ncbi:MAG TPA: efflux RND transporter permease subunit [Gemmatimonadaceae bacterium]|nr:efflux RND transporter permease subunit [Gemmatimonadaceae bacterium]
MFLSDVSIKRPVFATMLMVALVVLGLVSYQRLAIDEYPDVTYATIAVSTSYPGASPEVMMRQVSKPMEEALNTVQGIKEINSTSAEGSSNVRVTFHLGVNLAEALQDVQAKVARIRRSLPPGIDDPIVRQFDPNDAPIMSIALQSSERGIRELTDLADEVVGVRLEAIPGVGGINVNGGNARQIQVQLDPAAMRAYNVSPVQVTQALQRENQEVPAGRISHGATEQLVRISGRIEDPRAFGDIAVTVRNGVPVRISDVARIVDGAEERRSGAEIAGRGEEPAPAVSIEVLKISESNTVAVADSVRKVLRDLETVLPADVKTTIIRDQSKKIREALLDVEITIVLGGILTILIIYLFLNSWRSTVITGLTLPVSIISAFFIMWVFDFTLNTMTLLALSLAIGLLIDDAIVVRENIVRHLEMGKDHFRAAKEGTDEIGLAVAATSLAVVAVFFPVAFMGGMIGRIFMQFGVTVAFAVLVSLFVSFTLDPMLSSIWHDPEVEHGEAHGRLAPGKKVNPIRRVAFAFNAWFERVADRYPGWLRWSLGHRALVMGAATLSIVIAFLIIPRLGFTWMPEADTGELTVNFRTPPGSSVAYTLGKGREIADFLRKQPDVDFTYLSAGGGGRGGVNNGNVYVRLVDKDERRHLAEIQTELRGKLRTIPNVRPSISGQRTIFGGFGQPIRINVQGPEISRVKIEAARVLDVLRNVPGTAEPNSTDEGEIPQLDVQVDRQEAWRAGVGISSIAGTLQPLFAGQRATRWEDPQGYEHDVMVMYPPSMRTSAADVAGIVIPSTATNPATGQPAMIPLSQVADVRSGVGPQQIDRRNLEQQVVVNSGVLPGLAVGDVANKAKAAIAAMGLPPGYHTSFGGDVQNLDETKGYVLEALILACIFIYLILASLFGSFFQPLAIMLALPLSFIGVALALLITKGNINVMTMIGIIMLMGLVTKNGILLVDFTNQQREHGLSRLDAILSAGRIRLRPIIMTTVAMIFGMIPLALAIGEGAEQRAPMARAVIGGLITSTLLTLFVVPVVYTLLDDMVAWARHRKRVPDQEPVPAAGD